MRMGSLVIGQQLAIFVNDRSGPLEVKEISAHFDKNNAPRRERFDVDHCVSQGFDFAERSPALSALQRQPSLTRVYRTCRAHLLARRLIWTKRVDAHKPDN
jgi:hypothetical protein